jgi:hypothetical protein
VAAIYVETPDCSPTRGGGGEKRQVPPPPLVRGGEAGCRGVGRVRHCSARGEFLTSRELEAEKNNT